jgi:hypothetical protein
MDQDKLFRGPLSRTSYPEKWCNNRIQRRLIDVQLKHVRSAVKADDVKVEPPAADPAEIKRRRQNGFALDRPRGTLPKGLTVHCAAHQHRIRRIAGGRTVSEIPLADELARRQDETAPGVCCIDDKLSIIGGGAQYNATFFEYMAIRSRGM